MEIHKKFCFEAAHKLPNVPDEHKCKRLHGHSFEVTIHVTGDLDEQMGWVMDFGTIKTVFDPILNELDHSYLNEIDGLSNPTAENVARWIWLRLKPSLPELTQVDIAETCTSGCSYTGPNGRHA